LGSVVSLSITLDGMPEYGARLGLPLHSLNLSTDEIDPIYGKALPRALSFLARNDLFATFFPLGKYLNGQVQTALLRETLASGHEVGNYTSSGSLEFQKLSDAEVLSEIERGEEAIFESASYKPRGFCIPGRQGANNAAQHLKARGYLYDASAMALPAMAAAGLLLTQLFRRVGFQLPVLANEPRAVFAKSAPGPLEEGFPLWSLPVSAIPGVRVPLCGAVLSTLGEERVTWLARFCKGQPFVHITCNGLDFLAPDEVSDEVKSRLPYLKKSSEEREAALLQLISLVSDGKLLPLIDAYAALRNV
jgi:peptidoglycan/xylan/chitin deacetylase (PgdA/CDA1 family)